MLYLWDRGNTFMLNTTHSRTGSITERQPAVSDIWCPKYKCPNQQCHCHVLAVVSLATPSHSQSCIGISSSGQPRHVWPALCTCRRDEPRSKIPPSSSLCVYIRTYIYKTPPTPLGSGEKISRGNFSGLALVCASSSQVLYIKAIYANIQVNMFGSSVTSLYLFFLLSLL